MNKFFYFLILKRSFKNLGFYKFLLFIIIKFVIFISKNINTLKFYFFSSFSEKYSSNKDLDINSLFDYKNLSKFKIFEKNKLLKNRLKIFSNKSHNYSIFLEERLLKVNQINKSNRKKSKRIYEKFIRPFKNKTYLTNWSYDANSEFEWNISNRSDSFKIEYNKGFDIKIPWEISRLQLLSKICVCSFVNRETHDYIFIKNQIFDFIASNPPLYGVNWFNAMEVSIRGANLCMIADILIQEGKLLPKERNIIFNSINDHINFVINNLEWSPFSRNNHYLANIVGLLVMSYFLPRDDFTSGILSFSESQLFNEISNQFYNDGGNKEGSSAYHIFSSEIILIGLYFSKKLEKEGSQNNFILKKNIFNKMLFIDLFSDRVNKKYKDKIFKKVEKIISFSKEMKRNDNSLLQVGDNDSGCFFDLDFSIESAEKKKLHLLTSANKKGTIFDLIMRKIKLKSPEIKKSKKLVKNNNFTLNNNFLYNNSYFFRFPAKIQTKDLNLFYFKDFGLFCYSHKIFKLFVNCKENFDPLNSGHMHYDNLSVDFTFRKLSVITDPGSFLYTSNTSARSAFKSLEMHFCPFFKNSKGIKENYTFSSSRFFPAKALSYNNNSFVGEITYEEGKIIREIQFLNNGLLITDFSNDNPIQNLLKSLPKMNISSSYGVLSKSKIINEKFL